jgi:hypothetical protein
MVTTDQSKTGVGVWSEAEAKECLVALGEMFEGIPKSKRANFIGHLNEISCFLAEAGRRAKIA